MSADERNTTEYTRWQSKPCERCGYYDKWTLAKCGECHWNYAAEAAKEETE